MLSTDKNFNFSEWSNIQTTEWLNGLDEKLHQYIPALSQLNGKEILQLSLPSSSLDRYGIYKLGHQDALKDALRHLSAFNSNSFLEKSLPLQISSLVNQCKKSINSIKTGNSSHSSFNPLQTGVNLEIINGIDLMLQKGKLVLSFLDRTISSNPASKTTHEIQLARNQLIKLFIALTTTAQQSMFTCTLEENIETLITEIINVCKEQLYASLLPFTTELIDCEIPCEIPIGSSAGKLDTRLGINLKYMYDGQFSIVYVRPGSLAGQAEPCLGIGDQLCAVNGVPCVGWSLTEIVRKLDFVKQNSSSIVLSVKKVVETSVNGNLVKVNYSRNFNQNNNVEVKSEVTTDVKRRVRGKKTKDLRIKNCKSVGDLDRVLKEAWANDDVGGDVLNCAKKSSLTNLSNYNQERLPSTHTDINQDKTCSITPPKPPPASAKPRLRPKKEKTTKIPNKSRPVSEFFNSFANFDNTKTHSSPSRFQENVKTTVSSKPSRFTALKKQLSKSETRLNMSVGASSFVSPSPAKKTAIDRTQAVYANTLIQSIRPTSPSPSSTLSDPEAGLNISASTFTDSRLSSYKKPDYAGWIEEYSAQNKSSSNFVKSLVFSQWNERFVVIHNSSLYTYKRDNEQFARSYAYLPNCFIDVEPEPRSKFTYLRKFVIKISVDGDFGAGGSSIILGFKNVTDRRIWLGKLNEAKFMMNGVGLGIDDEKQTKLNAKLGRGRRDSIKIRKKEEEGKQLRSKSTETAPKCVKNPTVVTKPAMEKSESGTKLHYKLQSQHLSLRNKKDKIKMENRASTGMLSGALSDGEAVISSNRNKKVSRLKAKDSMRKARSDMVPIKISTK